MAGPGDITALLQKADQGDREAGNQLFPLVEADLRMIAQRRLQKIPAGVDLSATMLIDDVYSRLVGKNQTNWQPGDRKKFFGYMALRMEQLMIQTVRKEKAIKRGGAQARVEMPSGNLTEAHVQAGQEPIPLLDLAAALDKFERFAPAEALLFRLRYFLGCTFAEIAEVAQIDQAQAKKGHQRARAWLQAELKAYQP